MQVHYTGHTHRTRHHAAASNVPACQAKAYILMYILYLVSRNVPACQATADMQVHYATLDTVIHYVQQLQ
jgi:hypothetical protein